MEAQANPVQKVGEQNFQCPDYEACMAQAIESQWRFWTCCECPNRLAGTGVTLVKRSRPAHEQGLEPHLAAT
ncbi:MAG: hypothetical protein JRI36_06615 [Deltaproteobacteria bacterium]|nr:hypothetical protein [Deltaproteobacteria bacterium]